MDLWVLTAATAVGLHTGMANLSEKTSPIRRAIHWIFAGVLVIFVAHHLDHTRLPIWFFLSGSFLVGLAGWRLSFGRRALGTWGATMEASLAIVALWVVSADALAVIVGLVVGLLLAIGIFPTWFTQQAWVHELETLTLGAVGLQDVAHTVIGRLPPAEHVDWLWMVPWLVWADFTARSGASRSSPAKLPKPPRQPPKSSD